MSALCGYDGCQWPIPTITKWHPFGDGSKGTWTSVLDVNAQREHRLEAHPPKVEVVKTPKPRERYL